MASKARIPGPESSTVVQLEIEDSEDEGVASMGSAKKGAAAAAKKQEDDKEEAEWGGGKVVRIHFSSRV